MSIKSVIPSSHLILCRPLLIDVGGNSAVTGMTFAEGTVPDVRGMGLSDALYLLESVGMTVTHSGYGAVRTQSIEPGKQLTTDNLTIHLTLK